MHTPAYHLAQVNIAVPRAPLDSPVMAEFMAALGPVNALADASPGFIWRLQTPAGNATDLRLSDERMMVNLSVWRSVEELAAYVYRSDHTAYMRRRRGWFEHVDLYMALWWVPAGHEPTVAQAEERLEHLRAHGPTPHAFTFRVPFPSEEGSTALAAREDDLCPA